MRITRLYLDEQGRPRHTNCLGRACRVLNCRESLICPTDRGPISLPSDFPEQVIVDSEEGRP